MRELGDADVAGAVAPAALPGDVLGCLADLGRGDAVQAPKRTLPIPGGGFWLVLAGAVPRLGLSVVKWASFVPGGDGAPGRSTSTVLVADAVGGAPHTVVGGTLATRLRTGAATIAAVGALRPWRDVTSVGLVGMGPTNRAVLDALEAAAPEVGRLVVVVRTASSADRLSDELARTAWADRVTIGTDPAGLRGVDVAVSSTGSAVPVARVADLAPDGVAVALDGRSTWSDAGRVPTLSDQVSPEGRPSSLAQVAAGVSGVPGGRVLVDLVGAAVADVALAAHLLGARRPATGTAA